MKKKRIRLKREKSKVQESTWEECVEGNGEARWRRDLDRACSESLGRESAGQNKWKVRKMEGIAGGKGSTVMWRKSKSSKEMRDSWPHIGRR